MKRTLFVLALSALSPLPSYAQQTPGNVRISGAQLVARSAHPFGASQAGIWLKSSDNSVYYHTAAGVDSILNVGTLSIASVSGILPVANGGTGAATAAENLVLAGPTGGAAAAPSFRALVNADLPASGVSAGTYNGLTFNAQGLATAAVTGGLATTSFPTVTCTIAASAATQCSTWAPPDTTVCSGWLLASMYDTASPQGHSFGVLLNARTSSGTVQSTTCTDVGQVGETGASGVSCTASAGNVVLKVARGSTNSTYWKIGGSVQCMSSADGT